MHTLITFAMFLFIILTRNMRSNSILLFDKCGHQLNTSCHTQCFILFTVLQLMCNSEADELNSLTFHFRLKVDVIVTSF